MHTVYTPNQHSISPMSSLVETRQATVELVGNGTVEVRFKPGITLDQAGLHEVIAERERLISAGEPQAVLAIFPPDADFEIAIMTMDHYKGRKIQSGTRVVAVAANSLMHERMVSLYFAYFPQPFNAKAFVEEDEARAWLQEQLAVNSLN
jgi:SpoIIAA-like